MISDAPIRRAPSVAHSPIGPLREHRDEIADAHVAAFGAGEARRHDVGAHQHLFIGEAVRNGRKVGHGVRHQDVFGLASVDGVAELPAAHRLPPVRRAGPVLGMAAVEAGMAVAARRDRPGNHPLALAVAVHLRSELLDDADGFVADGQTLLDRILALEDVDVGAADRRRGDPDQRVGGADVGNRLVVDDDAVGLDEDRGFHFGHRHGSMALLRDRVSGNAAPVARVRP
jgi:hypothetical protein